MSKEKNKLKPVDAPVYGYWSALYLSFFSRRLYVDVGKRWKGFAFLYLLLAIALCSIPFFLRMCDNFNHSFKEQITDPLAKIPTFYIQNGEVSFDKPMPYFIKNDRDQVVGIIDTTGKFDQFTGLYPELSILINKTKIAFKVPTPQIFDMAPKPNNNNPIVQTFDKGTNLVFDGKKLAEEKSMTELKYVSQIMLYPMIAATLFSIFIIFFLVLGFLGQVFTSIFFSFKIPFVKSTRLLIVAGTPMILLLLIMLAFNTIFAGMGIVLFALLTAYYCFAVHVLRAESKQVVHS